MIQTNLNSLIKQAREILQSVENYPEKRLQLRQDFYRKYGYGKFTAFGFGNSEIAFLEWEIKRGVLNPLDDSQQKGSAWWRGVNGQFIYLATLAQLIYESGQRFDNIPIPVQYWLDYLNNPSAQNWYKAHNCSIVEGYMLFRNIMPNEPVHEQHFIRLVMQRVLYAGLLIEGEILGWIGKVLASPTALSVKFITNFDFYYPSKYPCLFVGKSYTSLIFSNDYQPTNILDNLIIAPLTSQLFNYAKNLYKKKHYTSHHTIKIPQKNSSLKKYVDISK
jgi:hypothetical protein